MELNIFITFTAVQEYSCDQLFSLQHYGEVVARLGLFVLCFIFSMFDDMNSLRKDCMTKVIYLLINNIIGIQLVYMVLQLIMIFWIFTQTYVSQWLVLCVLLCRLLFVLFLLVIV